MLQKICNNCKDLIPIDDYNYEDNFRIDINGDNIGYSGDLCPECETKIIDEIDKLMKLYNIVKEESFENVETTENTQ